MNKVFREKFGKLDPVMNQLILSLMRENKILTREFIEGKRLDDSALDKIQAMKDGEIVASLEKKFTQYQLDKVAQEGERIDKFFANHKRVSPKKEQLIKYLQNNIHLLDLSETDYAPKEKREEDIKIKFKNATEIEVSSRTIREVIKIIEKK